MLSNKFRCHYYVNISCFLFNSSVSWSFEYYIKVKYTYSCFFLLYVCYNFINCISTIFLKCVLDFAFGTLWWWVFCQRKTRREYKILINSMICTTAALSVHKRVLHGPYIGDYCWYTDTFYEFSLCLGSSFDFFSCRKNIRQHLLPVCFLAISVLYLIRFIYLSYEVN